MELRHDNIDQELSRYVQDLRDWRVPELPKEAVAFFQELKRGRAQGGPYPGVSIFEMANRVMSDLVVLFAARSLLRSGVPATGERVALVVAALGTSPGHDLLARTETGEELPGECFNVAPSFFATKHGATLRGLREVPGRKLIAFNHDAVSDANAYAGREGEGILYLPVNVALELASPVGIVAAQT